MEPFEFRAPERLADVLSEVSSGGAFLLGGATASVLMMKQQLLAPEKVVWLGKVKELRGVRRLPDGGFEIGATTTLAEIERDPAITAAYPEVARTAGLVGNARVRSVATVGGNLVHADPCQDMPPVLTALGASVRLKSASGSRTVPLDAFFVDHMETAAREDEVLTELILPPVPAGFRERYMKFTPRSRDDYATVGVAAVVERAEDGTVRRGAVVLGGVGATPVVVEAAADLLRGRVGPDAVDEVARAAEAACDPWDDQRGSEAYKRAMARVWTRRMLEEVLG